jgi:hypothetical protein
MEPDDDLLVHTKDRAKLRGAYKELFEGAAAILFRHDPVGLDYETNIDEYDTEVRTHCQGWRAAALPMTFSVSYTLELWQLWQAAWWRGCGFACGHGWPDLCGGSAAANGDSTPVLRVSLPSGNLGRLGVDAAARGGVDRAGSACRWRRSR